MIAPEVVSSLARHWDDGWNGADLEVIMAPFAPGIVFSSPFLPRLTGDPAQRTIDGADALRQYVVDALARASDVRYTLHRALGGMDSVVLVYTCHLPDGSDKPGADLLRVDGEGRVVEWHCHYMSDPTGWRD